MTTINEFNFQISEQGIVSSIASEGVPAVLLDHVKTAVERIQKSPLPLHQEFYRKLLENKSFKVANGGRHNKEVPIKPDGTLALKEVLTINIQTKKSPNCPIDFAGLAKIKKIEECFKSKAPPATETTPLKSITTVKKGPGPIDALFAWFATIFGSCSGRAPKKIGKPVVAVVAPKTDSAPQAPLKSTRDVPQKPLPPVPAPRTASTRAQTAPVAIRGIANEGNTCFINALFQMIIHDDALREALVSTYREEIAKNSRYKKEYESFLKAIDDYRKGRSPQLNGLRKLLSPNEEAFNDDEQGDAEEMLKALLRPVDQKKYPNLFTTLRYARRLEKFIPPKDQEKNYSSRFSAMPLNDKITYPENGIYLPEFGSSEFVIPVEVPAKATDGQSLINQLFSMNPVVPGDPAAYTKGWYRPIAEQRVYERPPERFMVHLKRFNNEGTKERPIIIKNSTNVNMPEHLTVQGQNYRLKSVAVHSFGHYYSLVRKESQWNVADDIKVSPAKDRDLRSALNEGYLYFYERV